jgi:hypothetical protein
MDGCIYKVDPTTRVATRVHGVPNIRLAFLQNLPPVALMASDETNAVLDKALRKMQQHPVLNDAGVAAEIARLKSLPR